jgi:hypothetical protein
MTGMFLTLGSKVRLKPPKCQDELMAVEGPEDVSFNSILLQEKLPDIFDHAGFSQYRAVRPVESYTSGGCNGISDP